VVHVAGVGPLLDLTDCGDIVVDPFLGSGSTLSAADKTGRVCRGVELDPLYVDVIVRRFEAATGNQAVLVETGETFEALATQGAGTGVGLRPAPAVADVADEPPRNGRLLPVKRAGACTAEIRGSNPLSSTRWSAQIDVISYATGQHLRTPANSGEGVGRHSPTRMRRSGWLSPEDHGDPYHTMRKFITIFLSRS
jgi:hypothetical protein